MELDLEKILAFLLGVWAAVSALVAITPSKRDDEIVGRVRLFLERLSFFQPKTSPGVLSMPGKPARPPLPPPETLPPEELL